MESGLKRLSVAGFSGLILCRGESKKDMTPVRSLGFRAGVLILVRNTRAWI